MAALRLLRRDEWEQSLRALNCSHFDEPKTGLETGSYWQTEHGRLFVVPHDAEGRMRPDALQVVYGEIARLRPLDIYD